MPAPRFPFGLAWLWPSSRPVSVSEIGRGIDAASSLAASFVIVEFSYTSATETRE